MEEKPKKRKKKAMTGDSVKVGKMVEGLINDNKVLFTSAPHNSMTYIMEFRGSEEFVMLLDNAIKRMLKRGTNDKKQV